MPLAELRRARSGNAAKFPQETLAAIQANLHPMSHAAIGDWQAFPWHRYAGSPKSSQALAVSVLGSIAALPPADHDAVMGALAAAIGVPEDGPWRLMLECYDSEGSLGEPTPTQVDAAAISASSILLLECKFTEAGGGCSQTSQDDQGRIACDGRYVMQTNPQNAIKSRCALTGKGVRYWDVVPDVYGLAADIDHAPCPFAFESYQWMRNVALAHSLAKRTGKKVRVLAAHAEAPFLRTAIKAAKKEAFGVPPLNAEAAVTPISYQRILQLAEEAAPSHAWGSVRAWLDAKIEAARPKRK